MQTQNDKNKLMFWNIYFVGTQHRNLHQLPVMISRVTCFILRAYTGTSVSHNQHRKTWERFWKKMLVNGLEGQKLARKKSPTVSVACMAIYWPTPGFKGRTFKLCVLNRWDFNFCIHSSPLWGWIVAVQLMLIWINCSGPANFAER